MKGAIDYVKKHRNVALVDLPYRVDAPNSIRLDRPLPFDAAFIWATPEARWVEDLLAASLPLVGASGDWPSEQVPYISFDGKAVEERAIEHLARRKPEILLHLEFLITGVPLIENRTRRFCDLARRRGFPVKSFELFRLGDPEDNSLTRRMPLQGKAAKRLKSLLRGLSRPAAIWCGDDWLGLRVCEAAVAFGLRIPEDVAVLGLGDFAGAEGGHPSLSSIPLPGETIAYHALTILDQRLSGKNDFPDRLLVSPPPCGCPGVYHWSASSRFRGESAPGHRRACLRRDHSSQGGRSGGAFSPDTYGAVHGKEREASRGGNPASQAGKSQVPSARLAAQYLGSRQSLRIRATEQVQQLFQTGDRPEPSGLPKGTLLTGRHCADRS
jgi:hypothetical protein